MQASEGDILEVSGRKRRQPACQLTYDGLLGHEINQIGEKLNKLDFKEDEISESELIEDPENEEADKIINKACQSQSSDCELGDEDYFYSRHGGKIIGMGNQVIKLNKQEEEDLIKDLEMQAQANDTLKELDEALMDRTTAQQTLRSKSQFMTQHAKINSSNF